MINVNQNCKTGKAGLAVCLSVAETLQNYIQNTIRNSSFSFDRSPVRQCGWSGQISEIMTWVSDGYKKCQSNLYESFQENKKVCDKLWDVRASRNQFHWVSTVKPTGPPRCGNSLGLWTAFRCHCLLLQQQQVENVMEKQLRFLAFEIRYNLFHDCSYCWLQRKPLA